MGVFIIIPSVHYLGLGSFNRIMCLPYIAICSSNV